MNRIITILVTIFILLLLYIWISHVWGNDKPRHPKQIVDARENEFSDDLMADADSTYHAPMKEDSAMQTNTEDEFSTERKTDAVTENKTTETVTTPPVEEKKPVEKKPVEKKPAETKTEPVAKKPTTAPKTETKTTSTPAKPESKQVTSASMAGVHLVIAGNFTQLANAQQRAQELKKAGYADTEVINFDLSEYHTVCAGRFSDVNEARKLVKKLKDYHKIDAYVRIGG